MKPLRLLSLLLVFCVDVRVRAEECLGKSLPCVVSGRHQFQSGGIILSSDASALLAQRDDGVVQLVRGNLYAEVSDATRIKTPFATVWCEGHCTAIFERSGSHVVIMSLGGEWRLERTGDPTVFGIKIGTRLTLSEVTSEGQAGMDFPLSLPWLPTLNLWARLFPGDHKEFKRRVEEFRPLWQAAVEEVADLDQQTAGREIASWNKAVAKAQAERLAQEREDADLRRLFREKNNLSP